MGIGLLCQLPHQSPDLSGSASSMLCPPPIRGSLQPFADPPFSCSLPSTCYPPQGLPSGHDQYFAMARGAEGCVALDMSKFFDTNYHYLVRAVDGGCVLCVL